MCLIDDYKRDFEAVQNMNQNVRNLKLELESVRNMNRNIVAVS